MTQQRSKPNARFNAASFSILLVALLSCPTQINAVSLADFTPRANGLTPSCQSVYEAAIPDCSASDFSTAHCSSACISSLVAVNTKIYGTCGESSQNNQMLVAAFLNGRGISAVCPNVVVTTVGGIPATIAPQDGSVQAPSSTSTHVQTAGTVTLPLSSVLETGILVDTSSSPLPSSTIPTIIVPPTSTQLMATSPTSSSSSSVATTASLPQSSSPPMSQPSTTVMTLPSTFIILSTRTLASTSSSSTPPHSSITTLPAPSLVALTSSSSLIAAISSSSTAAISSTPTAEAVSAESASVQASGCGKYGGDPFSYCSAASLSAAVPGLQVPATGAAVLVIAWALGWIAAG